MFTGKLHPYQIDAVESILRDKTLLVAYSMGTGKTVLTIAAVEELFARGEANCCLILVPASLKWQWAKSLAKFTDLPTRAHKLKTMDITVPQEEWCVVINGTAKKRAAQWEHVRLTRPDYVIASYGAVLNDWAELCASPIDAMVLDECTAIKNFSAKTSKRVKQLQPPVRIGLSGTPVENRPEEVYSICEWINRKVLGRWDSFEKSFIVRNHWGAVVRYKNLNLLHTNLKKLMVRKSRLDPEVAKYLPEVQETTRKVTLDAGTRKIYKTIVADLMTALEEMAESGSVFDLSGYYHGVSAEGERSAQGRVMARLMAARMLLDHPGLLMDSAEAFYEANDAGSEYIAELVGRSQDIPDHKATPKLNELDDVVGAMLADPEAKVAIFTDYRRMLPYLAERLEKHGGLVTFHGQKNADEKAAAKEQFASDPECRLFLSTNAGGYGLDLPEAQYLINYDLPHSAGVLAQRNTRHVRASSTHSHVYVMNLVCEETVEERQQATLALRAKLAETIVDGRGEATLVNDVESLTEHLEKDL